MNTLHNMQNLYEEPLFDDPCDNCTAVDSEMNLCKGCSANPENQEEVE